MKDYRKQNVCICFALSVLFYSFFCTYINYNIKTIPQESLTENKTVTETEETKQEIKLENFIAKTNKENSQEIKNYILKYSQEYNLDYKLLAGIIFIESKFDPNAFSEGSNAKGLGQLTPSCNSSYRLRYCNPLRRTYTVTTLLLQQLIPLAVL